MEALPMREVPALLIPNDSQVQATYQHPCRAEPFDVCQRVYLKVLLRGVDADQTRQDQIVEGRMEV